MPLPDDLEISSEVIPEAQIRLREGYQATRLVVDAYGDETAKAWLFGSNAELGSQAPAYMLRQARNWEDLRSIVPAARTFVRAEPGQTSLLRG